MFNVCLPLQIIKQRKKDRLRYIHHCAALHTKVSTQFSGLFIIAVGAFIKCELSCVKLKKSLLYLFICLAVFFFLRKLICPEYWKPRFWIHKNTIGVVCSLHNKSVWRLLPSSCHSGITVTIHLQRAESSSGQGGKLYQQLIFIRRKESLKMYKSQFPISHHSWAWPKNRTQDGIIQNRE